MKTTAKKKPAPKPAPRKAAKKGKGKPNIHMKAKALGIDTAAPEVRKPVVEMLIDPDWSHEPTGGAPTSLTPELGGRVCSLIAQRVPLQAIERLVGMPTEKTIYRWLAAAGGDAPNGALYDAFRQSFTRAKELRAETRSEAIQFYIENMTSRDIPAAERLDPQTVRVAIEGQRVLMEIENRSKYGKQVKLVGDASQPIGVVQSHALSDADLLAIAHGGLDQADSVNTKR